MGRPARGPTARRVGEAVMDRVVRARRVGSVVSFALAVLYANTAAQALQFQHLYTFDEGVYGPDKFAAGDGTPMGVTVRTDNGNLLIADSLDDQLYEVTASG